MRRLTDIHHHILYGLDDGPRTYREMADMLCAAAEDGIGTIYATPHITPGVEEFDEALMAQRLDEANDYCEAKGLPLRVLWGAEILYTPALENYLADHSLPTLGKTRHALVEFTPAISFDDMERAVRLLNRRSYFPILAHVERYRCLRWHPCKVNRLRGGNAVFFQVNGGSVLGGNGFWTKRFVWKLLKRRIADCVASDAHNTDTRKCGMASAYDLLCKKDVSYREFFLFSENFEKGMKEHDASRANQLPPKARCGDDAACAAPASLRRLSPVRNDICTKEKGL